MPQFFSNFFKSMPSALLVGMLAVAGCTKKGTTLEYGLELNETIRINILQEPPTLDWAKATDVTSAMIIYNTMETLVDFNLTDPNLSHIPSLALSWESNKDARIWTFSLRQGVRWTDGVEFTGQQVIDGWERLLNAKTASEYAYFLYPVKNAKAYNSGKIKDFKDVGVKLNEQGQLVVELEKTMSFFPMLLTHPATAPTRIDVIKKFGDKWTDPANIQTLGAYKLKIWDHDKAIVLERNDNYFGEKAKIKNILAYMIIEYSTALSLYDSGKLDFQETIPLKELPRYRSNPGLHIIPFLSIFYYGMNTRKPPFDNLKVRKAFSHAIDRKQITDLLAGGQAPLTGWIPVGMFGYEKEVGLNFDPELAKSLLDEAGYKDRAKFPKITLAFNTNENHQRVAENVQAQVKKTLGIEIQLANEEWKVYLNRLRNDTPSMYRLGWVADYPDPDNFINLMTSYSENNHTGWKNKKYDEIVELGASDMDPAKRRAYYLEAQTLLTQTEVPVIPLFSDVRPILLSARVKKLSLNALNRWIFKGVTLK